MSDFGERLLAWFDAHGRKDLPWQHDKTPYRVWISEIMLQQTQVQTVVPYYERFMRSFPDLESLANAGRDDVLSHWSGLGYYARARNLHKAAQVVRDKYAGNFPENFERLVALPGIGRSTAAAVLSIACGQRHAILDGNVKRVLARHAMIEGWPGKSAVASALWQLAGQHTPMSRVADYTQAIMDLGATLCTRSKPGCGACPVAGDCKALANDVVADFPGRLPKKDKPLRSTTMVLASHADAVLLQRRPEAGIWGGLWSLPELAEQSLQDWCSDVLQVSAATTEAWKVLRHSFSHYDLDIHPVMVRLDSPPLRVADSNDETWHQLDEAPPGGIAAPVRKLIDQLKKKTHASHY